MVMVVADELEVVFECSDICSEHVHCLDISWPLLSEKEIKLIYIIFRVNY